jgi:hypothetical protein
VNVGNIDLNPISVLKRHGVKGAWHIGRAIAAEKMLCSLESFRCRLMAFKFRNAAVYANPTADELLAVEDDLGRLGVAVNDFWIDRTSFTRFKASYRFPDNYHGGCNCSVWEEKLLEHFIAFHLLTLDEFGEDDVYVDIAAGGSPWVRILREKSPRPAFAIDLHIADEFAPYDFYRIEDATRTSFSEGSVHGCSLQCAYEMFAGRDDIELLIELKRFLVPGGKAVIVPFYMHTHYCCFATPEYYGKGCGDKDAKEYIRWDCCGVPSSRKYDAIKFKERIIDKLADLGMSYRLFALRNAREISPAIYCHFVLEITR